MQDEAHGAQLRHEIEQVRSEVPTLVEQGRTFLSEASARYIAAGLPYGNSLDDLMAWERNRWRGDVDRSILDAVTALIEWSRRPKGPIAHDAD
jgi:hypothetical protein